MKALGFTGTDLTAVTMPCTRASVAGGEAARGLRPRRLVMREHADERPVHFLSIVQAVHPRALTSPASDARESVTRRC